MLSTLHRLALATGLLFLLTVCPSAALADVGLQPVRHAGEVAPTGFTPLQGTFRGGSFQIVTNTYASGNGPSMFVHGPVGATATPFTTSSPFPDPEDHSSKEFALATNDDGDQAVVWTTGGYDARSVRVAVRPAGTSVWSTSRNLITQDLLDDDAEYNDLRPRVVVTDQGRIVVTWETMVAPGGNTTEAVHDAWASYGTVAASAADMSGPVSLAQEVGDFASEALVEALVERGDGDVFVVSRTVAPGAWLNYQKLWLHRLPAQSAAWQARQRVDSELADSAGDGERNPAVALAFDSTGVGTIAWNGESGTNVVLLRGIAEDGSVSPNMQDPISGLGAQSAAVGYDDEDVRTIAWLQRPSADDVFGYRVRVRVTHPENPESEEWMSTGPGMGLAPPVIAHSGAGGRTFVAWHQQPAGTADQTSAWLAVRERGELAFEVAVDVSGAVGTSNLAVFADHGDDAAIAWTEAYGLRVRPIDETGPVLSGFDVPETAVAGSAVRFAVDPTDTWSPTPDESIEWSVNGVSNGTGRVLSNRSFPAAGEYTVIVTATDAAGNSRSASRIVSVAPAVSTGGDGGSTGGSTGGGSTGGGVTPPVVTTPEPDAPQPFVLTDTASRDKVPAVVGLKVSTARDRFDRAGINSDFDIRMITRAKAPRGITIGEVMTQKPRAGTTVTTGLADREPVRLDVYAGPAVKGAAIKANCTVTRVNAAVKGLELDLAKLVLKSMKCPYQVDVRPVAKGDDAAVTGATTKRGLLTLGVNVPRKPTNNDLLLTFRENPNGISFDADNWTLTAGQKNAFTFQATTKVLVDGEIPFIQKANVTIDMSGVGGPRNLNGHTDAYGEKITVLEPPRAGFIDILVEYPGANDQSLWGTARLKVVDRSAVKVNSKLVTVSGRVFQKHKAGIWVHQPGATAPASRARDARFINFGGLLSMMQNAVAGIGGAIGSAFSNKGVPPEQTLSTALAKAKVSPSQMLIRDSLVSGNVKPIELRAAEVVSAGGGNVVAAGGANVVAPGGANVVAPGGANVVAAGGGNVVAAGGGNVIAAGGANGLAASAPGLIAMGPAGIISHKGGNVVAAGGMNLIGAAGGNLLSDNGLGRRPGS